jgi:hypothetical protein
LQGITSLSIKEEGNPIYQKPWRQYAIYRLEHWGLLYINNRSGHQQSPPFFYLTKRSAIETGRVLGFDR